MRTRTPASTWSGPLLRRAAWEGFLKLDPRAQFHNPVMAVVWLGAVGLTLRLPGHWNPFEIQIVGWLWLTLWFANLAEALAEGRGRAQAAALRQAQTNLTARRLRGDREERVPAALLEPGDQVVCEAGDAIPADGEVVEGIASVDESAITGESAPVIRESGGDRSAVTGGTRVLSDRLVIRVTSARGHTFLDRMIGLVERAQRQRTPNERALSLLLLSLTALFVLVVFTLPLALRFPAFGESSLSLTVLVALLACLVPTTIGGLLSAIGISGMDRLVRHHVLATSGRAVEAAGDVDVLLLDKTGTITLGNRQAVEFRPAPGVAPAELAEAAQLASLADETPEGRSVVVLAKERFGLRPHPGGKEVARLLRFSAETRLSGVDLAQADGAVRPLRKGAVEAVQDFARSHGLAVPEAVLEDGRAIGRQGGTPLLVSDHRRVYGLIHLKDVVKGGIRERFQHLRRMGIRTIMVTGDNPLTAAAIAAEAGVDDFMAEARPEDKLARIRQEQARGHLVAMMGDGTNDAPALAQADVGVAMNSGTQAAREAGNMVDLDSNPTKLIEIVEIGKRLLLTRGALTTFSLANDLAKYFAILPAMFGGLLAGAAAAGPLARLNVMHLHSPESAILSAVIFNALIIPALIPLALLGVPYRPVGAAALLRGNLLVYGLGGVLLPFAGIKGIDLLLTACGLV